MKLINCHPEPESYPSVILNGALPFCHRKAACPPIIAREPRYRRISLAVDSVEILRCAQNDGGERLSQNDKEPSLRGAQATKQSRREGQLLDCFASLAMAGRAGREVDRREKLW